MPRGGYTGGLKYDFNLLMRTIIRDSAILIDYDRPINRNSKITFVCNCGLDHKNMFRYIVENAGAYCKSCTYNIKERKTIQTNQDLRGVNFPTQSPEVREKCMKTTMDNFGVKNPGESVIVQEKSRETCRKKYGVDYAFQSEEVKAKIIESNIAAHGVEHPMQNNVIRDKQIKTVAERYGVENVSQSEIIKQKKIDTSLERYGVPNPMQSSEIQERIEKSAFVFKEYTMPSGEIRKYQGYENLALDELLTLYSEHQIVNSRSSVPRIEYKVYEEIRYHFPDIFIPHENKIIEVKSTWTFECKQDNVLLKKKTAEEQGFLYEIWIYDNKGNKTIV